jgi:hypothetical protein
MILYWQLKAVTDYWVHCSLMQNKLFVRKYWECVLRSKL